MKMLRVLVTALFAATFFSIAAYASDPTGTWKWTSEGRNGPRESTVQLELKEGVLTGSISGRNSDTPIGDATFKDGVIAFTTTRERNGNKSVSKFSGKLEGDTITGTYERPGRNGGEANKTEWKAMRQKAK